MMNRAYIDAVRLLLEVAPEIFREPVFAFKGGTSINLFLQDMPRLSVDLDLVYIDHLPATSLPVPIHQPPNRVANPSKNSLDHNWIGLADQIRNQHARQVKDVDAWALIKSSNAHSHSERRSSCFSMSSPSRHEDRLKALLRRRQDDAAPLSLT